MIIGFGIIEEEKENSIIHELIEKFGDIDDTDTIEKELLKIIKENQAQTKKYDEMSQEEAPSRYTRFVGIVFPVRPRGWIMRINFHHINRRHALSPDGWAAMINERLIFKDFLGNIEILRATEKIIKGDKQ
jgi:hypothetical protein